MRNCVTALMLVLWPSLVAAQPDPELAVGAKPITGLSRATSLRVDPAGLIYIADPGRHVIDVRRPDGRPVSLIGGPGTGGGQFDGPMDVDPTNGLIVVVADAGNGRIARFSSRYQLIESTTLYGASRARAGESASVVVDDEVGRDLTPGRPVAVVLNESNEVYAIDDTRNVVAKWDNGRRLVTIIGDDPGSGRLFRPVDLEVIGDQLYVADSEAGSVLVFDLFGAFVSELGGGRLTNVVGLGGGQQVLWVLYGNGLAVYSSDGTLEGRYRLPAGAPGAVDVAVTAGSLYVLTSTSVFRWDLDPQGRPPTDRG